MHSGWAELNFENLGSSTSLAAPSGAGRHSVDGALAVTSTSSTSLFSQRLSRSTLPYSVSFHYLSISDFILGRKYTFVSSNNLKLSVQSVLRAAVKVLADITSW